jgi:hypothetical protein
MGPVLDLQGVRFGFALLGLVLGHTYGQHCFGISQVLAAFLESGIGMAFG